MRQLTLAFYGEGNTDRLFLPPLLTRTLRVLLAGREVEVVPPVLLDIPDKGSLDQAARILNVARQAENFDLLVVHADSDSRDWEQARRARIEPGFTLVRQTALTGSSPHLVALMPVQEMEAWIISDPAAIQHYLRSPLSPADLGLPAHAAQVERDAAPKETLNRTWQLAQNHRPSRRRVLLNTSYESLAGLISLDRLRRVPSYQRFETELTNALQSLGFLTP